MRGTRRGRARRRILCAVSGFACALLVAQSAVCALRGFGGPAPGLLTSGPVPVAGAPVGDNTADSRHVARPMPCHGARSGPDASAPGGDRDRDTCRLHCALYDELLPGQSAPAVTPAEAWNPLPAMDGAPLPIRRPTWSRATRLPPALAPPLARTAVLRL